MEKSIEVIVKEDYEALSQAVAHDFLLRVKKAILEKGIFSCALSGGSTPKRFYEILGGSPYQTEISWDKIHFFFSDERCVPPDHAASNFKMIQEHFFSKIKIPSQNIHRMKGELEPEKAALDYEMEMRKIFSAASGFPVMDLMLLGMGEDGHTASLFPHTAALHEKKRWVTAYYVEKLKMFRMTLTFPVINAAQAAAFLVSGSEKAEIVSQVLGGKKLSSEISSAASGFSFEVEQNFPAQMVSPVSGELIWFLDAAAAKFLNR
jgi:6-phosphogluconolactonase